MEYTDSEIDNAATEHQEKSLHDQHSVAHQSAVHMPVSGAPSVQDPSSSAAASLTESSLVASSAVTVMSVSGALVMSSASVTASFPETASFPASLLSSKPCEASVAKCLVTSEEAAKSEGSRTSDSSAKSVPTTGFMTTDFQAKFLEFSQRKAACVAAGQSVPIDDPESAGLTSSVKGKKVDMLVTPPTQKKSSPVADEPMDSVEVKSGECHSSSSEGHPELPTTSLPMQVDGCCDSSSDNSDEESDVLPLVDMTMSCGNYSAAKDHMEFLNVEEPELIEIWLSSVGLQVDGAADDEIDAAEESQQKGSSNSDVPNVAGNQHQLADASESEPAADATGPGMGSTVAPVGAAVLSCLSVVSDSNVSMPDSVVASVTSSESTVSIVSKQVDMHLPTDTASDANLSVVKDSESVVVMPQLPSGVNMSKTTDSIPSGSGLQPTVSKTLNLPVEITASLQGWKSETAATQALEYSTAEEARTVTTTATAALATSLASELQSSAACGEAALSSAASFASSELMSQNPVSDSVMSSGQVINQSVVATTTQASALSLPSVVVSSESCTVKALVTGCEATTVESGVLSHRPVVTSILSSDSSAAGTSSQLVESYSVAASAVSVDSASVSSVSGTDIAITSAASLPATSHVDSSSNNMAANQAFNSSFQLRPEMQHAPVQQFMGHPPRRMYLPPDVYMQQRMMHHGMPASEGMMIPAEQLPHGPPPPYPNKQFTGPQTFWVRQQHPSGVPPEWIRHPGDFGPRPLPPNLGSHEWPRPQMMPAEWSARQRMQQEWAYFSQQPHHPSQAPPNQWVRAPYSNMPGFQLGSGDAASMPADAYSAGYQPVARNTAGSAAVAQDAQVAQGIKSPRPSSHHSASPVPASPASARADIASPQSRSHTPRSLSRSSTPLGPAPMSGGAPGMSHTPDHVTLPAASGMSPHPSATTPLTTVSVMPTSSPLDQASVPSSSSQAADRVSSLSSEMARPASASASGLVSAVEHGTSQPSLAAVSGAVADSSSVPPSSSQLAAFSHVSAENMMYIHRPPPHGVAMSPEMRRMGPPTGGRYVAPPPPQGMYMSGHPAPGTSGMTFYRMPSSAATTQSAIGALLNQQRVPVHYPAVTQPPGAPVMEPSYQLVHTQDAYLAHSQRHIYSSAVTVAGPSVSGSGSFVLQHQHRGPAPPLSAESAAGHQEVPNQASVLLNSMQTPPMLRGPFRMPQQLGPGAMPLGMRLAGSGPPVVYGPQRPVPPSKVRMIAAPEMRPQMIHIPRSSVAEFAGPAYRPRPQGEQPLLLEDLLEQVCNL